MCALVATGLLGVPLFIAFDEDETWLVYAGSLIQYAAFVVAAVGFARLKARPRASDFGLRRPNGWSALGWAGLALFGFWMVAGIYGAIVAPEEDPEPLEGLGLEDGRAYVWLAGILVIFAAPVVEEFFFRGFFYPALRARWRVAVAALATGVVFGALHVFNGALFVPPLMVFGVVLCLLYERTRSLYPGMAIHALQNTLAFGFAAEEPAIALALGSAMMALLLGASVRSPARAAASG